MSDALVILMRWLHLSSMATLVGGFLYSRLVATPAAGELTPGTFVRNSTTRRPEGLGLSLSPP